MPRPNTNVNTLRRILQQELALGRRMASIAQEEKSGPIRPRFAARSRRFRGAG